MTLRREEASTSNRHARLTFGVTVICCDKPMCPDAWLVGIGEGDDLPSEAAADAEACGWQISSEGDFCPAHAGVTL